MNHDSSNVDGYSLNKMPIIPDNSAKYPDRCANYSYNGENLRSDKKQESINSKSQETRTKKDPRTKSQEPKKLKKQTNFKSQKSQIE